MALPRSEQGGVRIARMEGVGATYQACGAVPQRGPGVLFWEMVGSGSVTAKPPERDIAGGKEA